MVELFPYDDFAQEAVSGRVAVADVARKVQSLVADGLVAGGARMARAFLDVLPGSQYIRRVVAWYASRKCPDFRVLPIKVGGALDAAVDCWDVSDGRFRAERERSEAVVREGSRARGALVALYAVLGPHGPQDLERAVSAAARALAAEVKGRGDVHYVSLPLPPDEELGEFDV